MVNKQRKLKIIEEFESHNKVLYWFFSYPNIEISLSDLAKELSISKNTANKIVSLLQKEGFLDIKILGRTWRITCNKHHIYNYTKKIGFNLSAIYDLLYSQGLVNEIYKKIGQPRAIVLFGSYRKGDDTENSDIDLAIEVLGDQDLKIINLETLPNFVFRKNVRVNLYIYSRKKIDLNLFSNIINGIVLEGFLEVKL